MSDALAPDQPRRWLIPFICGLVAAAVVAVVCVAATVEFGLFDIRASVPHNALVSWAAHDTFIHYTKRTAGDVAPRAFTAADVDGGRRLYVQHCEACHGGPATPRADWAAGLNPPPPYLLDMRNRWTPAQLHRIIAEGVKMTAMPAWRYTLSDGQVWDLAAFLESLPSSPPSAYVKARQHASAAGAPKSP